MVLRKNANEEIRVENLSWSPQPDLNQRPSDYESPALTTELWGDWKVVGIIEKNRVVVYS